MIEENQVSLDGKDYWKEDDKKHWIDRCLNQRPRNTYPRAGGGGWHTITIFFFFSFEMGLALLYSLAWPETYNPCLNIWDTEL